MKTILILLSLTLLSACSCGRDDNYLETLVCSGGYEQSGKYVWLHKNNATVQDHQGNKTHYKYLPGEACHVQEPPKPTKQLTSEPERTTYVEGWVKQLGNSL